MSTLQSLSLSSPGCFHSSLAFEQIVFVFFLTFFILRKMVDLPHIIPCSPEVHVQNYIFATMKYSLEFMWNKSVHAFIQYLLCDCWCLWGQHFKGKRMPPHQSEHWAWVTTKDWASTPPDCYKAQLFPGKVWVLALPLTNWIILVILLLHLKKKMGKGTVSEGMLWEFNEITLSDSPEDPWHQEIYHFLNPLIRSYIPWVQPSTASQLRCSVYCSFLILNPHDNPIDTGNPTWQVWKLRKWFMTLGIQSQDCIRKWLQPPGTTARLSEFKSQLHYLLVI